MTFWESVRIALSMLKLHKLRAFLTMLGVIIGVASVTIIIMVSGGFQYYLTHEMKKLGSDTLILAFDPGRREQGESLGGIEGLTNADVDYVMNRIPGISLASGIYMVPTQKVTYGEKTVDNPRIYATDENQAIMSRVGIQSGRHMNHADLENRANVAVIGDEIKTRLFGQTDPLGKLITFRGVTLEVIGVMGVVEMFGEGNKRDIWVPITTAQAKWVGGDSVNFITARPAAGYTVEQAMDALWQGMMRKSGNKPVYRVDSRESIIKVFGAVIGVAQMILAAIAALSLLVGGIGIMNIMLVSVTERTREIGLRKAVGATKTAVLSQFLVEAAVLSLVGGLIGMGCAYMVGLGMSLLTMQAQWPSVGGLPTPFPFTSGLAAAAFSALIGVVFGMFPAVRASQLSPIDALRAE